MESKARDLHVEASAGLVGIAEGCARFGVKARHFQGTQNIVEESVTVSLRHCGRQTTEDHLVVAWCDEPIRHILMQRQIIWQQCGLESIVRRALVRSRTHSQCQVWERVHSRRARVHRQ